MTLMELLATFTTLSVERTAAPAGSVIVVTLSPVKDA